VLEWPSAKLSKGMLQRVALMEAVHAGPAVLLLDEPFAGLDPEGRQWLAAQLSTGGPAVLLTDHSGAAAGRVALAGRLELRNGRCTATAVAASLTIRAVRAGERLERAVPEDASDALLADLLAGGWHIERVER
jgi:ABC-type multidrug transport system ATPase subunit